MKIRPIVIRTVLILSCPRACPQDMLRTHVCLPSGTDPPFSRGGFFSIPKLTRFLCWCFAAGFPNDWAARSLTVAGNGRMGGSPGRAHIWVNYFTAGAIQRLGQGRRPRGPQSISRQFRAAAFRFQLMYIPDPPAGACRSCG